MGRYLTRCFAQMLAWSCHLWCRTTTGMPMFVPDADRSVTQPAARPYDVLAVWCIRA
jgi:hypothetical protein